MILEALQDDLNTPLALSHLHSDTRDLRIITDSESQSIARDGVVARAFHLGLLQQDPEDWFKWQPPRKAGGGPDDDAIEALIAERNQARDDKDFARADEIRDELAKNGVLLEDGPGGTTWKRG